MIHVPTRAEIENACSRSSDVPHVMELHPSARRRCVDQLIESRSAGVPFLMAQAYRSPLGQKIEYAKGRKSVGDDLKLWIPEFPDGRGIVTHALPWQSWHQYRLAWDVVLLMPDGKRVHWNEVADLDEDGRADWLEVVEIGESLGLEAGYRWTSRKHDGAHFQFRPGLSLEQAWNLCVTGKPIPDDYFEEIAA